MAWEIEKQHVDLSEMEHVTVFVEKGVINRDGQPARHLLQIRLGDDLQLTEDGHLEDAEGNRHDPREHQQRMLDALNEKHTRARRFARRHNAELLNGGK
jgi:hypothetical protein